MINSTLTHLAAQLNQYFKANYQLHEDIAVVSNLIELDGNLVSQANNKLVLTLTNIEKDTLPQRSGPPQRGADDRIMLTSNPLYLNLYVMLSANFGTGNYTEALKYISNAITFFQHHAVSDRQNSPDLDPRIEKLILDIENLKIHDLNNLWSMLGGKYLPSVYYRVRMLAIPTSPSGQAAGISQPASQTTRRE